jgi:hypothetical protein
VINLDPFRRLVHQGAKPKWRGVNDVYWPGRFDSHTRGNQLDWNCFRVGGDLWTSALAGKGRLDGVVPGHDGSHQRDGILLPIHKLLPRTFLGAISLVLLAFAIAGRYKFQLAGA